MAKTIQKKGGSAARAAKPPKRAVKKGKSYAATVREVAQRAVAKVVAGARKALKPTKPKRKRDHKKAYARRLEMAELRDLSRSQARGHAKEGELTVKEIDQLCQDATSDKGSAGRRRAHDIMVERFGGTREDREVWAATLSKWCGFSRQFAYSLFHSP